MNFSVTSDDFRSQSMAAYSRFEKGKIPFTAVKLYVAGPTRDRAELENIVGKNFRSEKDIILKSEKHFAVLLNNTCLEAAEEAMNRLMTKLHRIKCNSRDSENNGPLNVTACLYGACEDAGGLYFKYIDLTTINEKNSSEKKVGNFTVYSKWGESKGNKKYKSVSVLA